MVETISQECEKNAVQSNLKNHTVTKYPIQYINRDGNPIVLKLSRHARWRFITRWQLVFPEKSLTEESVDKEIAVVFSHASRVKNLSKHDRKRLNKHGKDTLFFRTNKFTFVVQNATIATIELSDDDERYLNKKPIHNILSIPTKPIPIQKPLPTEDQTNLDVEDLPRYKLTASATTDEGKYRFVNLGSYDSKWSNGDPQLLRSNRAFSEEMKLKFHEKQPTWTIRTIYATLGKNGDPVRVFDENDDYDRERM